MPRHEDDGLTHEEQKQASEQVKYQDQSSKKEKAIAKNIIDNLLAIKAVKELVDQDVFGDQVKGMPNNLRRYYTKDIGDDYEDNPRNNPPFIFIEVFV